MRYSVQFTLEAREDLRAVRAYIAIHDSPSRADHVAHEIVRAAMTLREFPMRGSIISDVPDIEKYEYRQVFFKPYRVIYRVVERSVFILVIADGRRNLQTLLVRRLTRP